MELLPVGLGSVVPLTADVPVVALGRLNYSVHDTRISRQHVTARLSHQGGTQSITITALKPVYVEHSGGDTTQLSQGQTCQVGVDLQGVASSLVAGNDSTQYGVGGFLAAAHR